MASLFVFLRRCPVAKTVPPGTSSSYSLQGTSEKIHFQNLIRQESFQLEDLLAQDQLAGSLRGRIALVESITPNVKQSSTYPEIPRERDDVVARVHSFNGLTTKFVTVPLPLFSFHFAAPFPQSVLYQTVSL